MATGGRDVLSAAQWLVAAQEVRAYCQLSRYYTSAAVYLLLRTVSVLLDDLVEVVSGLDGVTDETYLLLLRQLPCQRNGVDICLRR